MANDHAKDRYDPPAIGSEFDEDKFSEINPGEVFRFNPSNDSKTYRKTSDTEIYDIKEKTYIVLTENQTVYVKS